MKWITALVLCLALAGCYDYSDGERIGVVTKFSKKGLFCKTWEGELLMGGLKRKTTSDSNGGSHTTSVANLFEFTIEDRPDLVAKVQSALAGGDTVKMTYKQELITICRSDGSDSFVTDVVVEH